MGFAQRFGRNMAKRSRQYAIRSTYPLLDPRMKTSSVSTTKSSKRQTKEVERPVDKCGNEYWGQTQAKFGGKTYTIMSVEGKMATLSDGKRHRISSCELI